MIPTHKSKRLVAFVGPSGSGKDTLMVQSRDFLLSSGIKVKIVQRWITRKKDNTEQFRSISTDQFNRFISEEKFSIHWEIYGNQYGIPKEEIDPYLEKDILVLVNVSRSSLVDLKRIYPQCKIVVIDVTDQVAKERILHRKRDTGINLEARLNRLKENVRIPFPDLILKNEKRGIKPTLSILLEFLRALQY